MKILKSFAVGLFSFLLFWCILLFGVLFGVKSTVLNPDFVTARINEVAVAEIMDAVVDFGGMDDAELYDNIQEIVSDLEPVVKERMAILINAIYDYMLDKEQDAGDIKEAVGESFMNPEFVASVLVELSLPELVDKFMPDDEGDDGMPQELKDAIPEIVADFESDLKDKVVEVSGPVFDYLLGKTQDIDLSTLLREKVLNEEFVTALIEKIDLVTLAEGFVKDQLIGQIPEEMEFLTDHIDEALVSIEPIIKEEITESTGPILDYLLGVTSRISIEISLDPVLENLENVLKDEFLSSPPDELSDLSRSELEEVFDEFFSENMAEMFPETFVLDETMLGPEIAANIAGALDDIENNLADVREQVDEVLGNIENPDDPDQFSINDVRQYLSYFQLAYYGLMGLIALLVIAIILLLRDVRAITRKIGVPLLTYGIVYYAAILIGKYFMNGKIRLPDEITPGMEDMIFNMANAVVRPMEIFALALLIIGLILTVVSFVYRRGSKEDDTYEVTD